MGRHEEKSWIYTSWLMGAQLREHSRAHVLSRSVLHTMALHFSTGLLHLPDRRKRVDPIPSHGLLLVQCQFEPIPERLRAWYRTDTALYAAGWWFWDVVWAVPLQGRHIQRKTANTLLPYLKCYTEPFWRQDEGDKNRNNRFWVAVKFHLIFGLFKSKNTWLLFSLRLTVSSLFLAFWVTE